MKRNNKKGFTLAELLIVVAIIAVLVAIAIPVFGAQLEKAKEATDLANIRALYAEQVTAYLDTQAAVTGKSYTLTSDTSSVKTTNAGTTKIGDKTASELLGMSSVTIAVAADGTVSFS